jgi:hypothetical protein
MSILRAPVSILRGQLSNGAEAIANMGEPSEREALLTILLSYACKGVLRSYLTLGCEKLILPAEGWPYLHIWTVCPCIYAYVI